MRLLLFTISILITSTLCNSKKSGNGTSPKADNATAPPRGDCDSAFSRELNKVIDLSSTGFASLKGKELTLDEGQTAFASTFTFHGTSHNKIGVINGNPYYMAKISGKVSEDEAKRLVNIWTEKVTSCLNTPFAQQVPYRLLNHSLLDNAAELRDGILFKLNKQHAVAVYWTNYANTELYEVVIAVV